jgi:hypothetical protein
MAFSHTVLRAMCVLDSPAQLADTPKGLHSATVNPGYVPIPQCFEIYFYPVQASYSKPKVKSELTEYILSKKINATCEKI